MSGSSSSSNLNNTGPTDSEYITEVSESHALRYWVPTSSKLSRGVKGTIQRVFTGEPLNNLCNVYIYNETSKSWFHEYTITGSSGEDFGRSLDGTDNADMVAIGAPGTWFGSVSTITGYARVFTKDSSGNGWTQRGASVSQTGGFGHSVALSQYDGNILVVGAPFYNTLIPLSSGTINFRSINVSEGKVYIYKWNGTNYILQQTLNSPSGTLSASITPSQSQSFYFGYSLGITDIGDKIIVGEPAIRNIWYVPDQLQQGSPGYWSSSEFPYTGNAHVYDNFTVLSGGTTWTSNVSMTSVIGTTGIGTSLDLIPTHVRWLDALGTSVDINRNGTRILAGGPGSYGTSNAAPHFMTGRIYTLEWNSLDGIWEEMGQNSKHIVAPKGQMLLGMNTRFDGSGRRIVTGCTGFVDHINYEKGDILIYDWNGDQWVNFPGENVEIIDRAWNASDYWTNWQWRLGESISIDGEGEMISFGVSEHKFPHTSTGGVFRPNAFNVDNITYIGGATTTTAGSSSTVTTGSSNIWVYNINQSMVVKGNVTVGGYVQATGMSIGTEDDSSTSTKSLYFGGSKSDNSYDLTVIENRVYDNEEKAELLLFKGNDNADPTTGGGTFGPDRIRLKAGQIAFDLNAGYDRTQEDIRAVMHRNAGGAGMLGINVSVPTEVIHVDGKIKCTQGFIGKGTEITGIDLDYVVRKVNTKLNNQAGVTVNPIQLGEYIVSSAATYPTVGLTGNSSNGYTVNASRDTANAYKAFNNNTGDYWEIGTNTVYSNGSNRGAYLGSTEKISGYKGEWIELILPNQIFVTELQIYCRHKLFLPRRSYTFGSNDGIEYVLIQDSGDKGYYWGTSATYNTIYTRTPDTLNDDAYNRILIIAESLSGGNIMEWNDINILGQTATLSLNMKFDNTGKIGIGTTNPNYKLDVVGTSNFTDAMYLSGSAGTPGQVLTSSGSGGAPTWTTVTGSGVSPWTISGSNIYYTSGNVGIGTSTPGYKLHVVGTSNFTDAMYLSGSAGTSGQVLTSSGTGSAPTWTTVSTSSYWTQTGSNIYYTSGNVGIGTTTPGYNLHVVGTSNFTDAMYLSGSAGTSGQVLTSSGSGGAPTWTTVSSGGSSPWTISGSNIYYNSGNVGIGTSTPGYKLHVVGTSNFTDAMYLSGSAGTSGQVLTSSGAGGAPTWTTVSSGGSSPWTISGSNIYYTSGNVGIGTTNPNYKLHVAGTSNFTDAMYLSGSAGTSGQVLTSSGSGGAPTWTTVSSGGSSPWTISGSNIYYTSGNVGIGTTNPNYKLHVAGRSNFTDAMYLSGSAGTSGQVLTSSGSGGAPTWTTVSGGSSVWTTGTGTEIYYTSGNVGIGTSTPGYNLHVAGTSNFTNAMYLSGSAGTSGQVLTSSGTGGAPTWTTVTGSGVSPWTLSGSNIYRSSGNVGIGTTTPAYPLDVQGDIRTTSENGFIGNGRYITGINVTSERGSTIINFGQQSSLVQSVNGSPL